MSDTAKEYQIAYDAFKTATVKAHGLDSAFGDTADMQADRYARSLGYAPATPEPERRVVELFSGSTQYRVTPDALQAASDYPFEVRCSDAFRPDKYGWGLCAYLRRNHATPGTILGDLLAHPNVGDVLPPLPPLPAITDEHRAKMRAWSAFLLSSEARQVYDYLAKHCPRADGAA
jgi:hypothetical protein